MRYLRDFGATTKSFAEIAVAHRYHASLNPKALMRTPITIEDHQRSRWVAKPFRLLDCCLETDVAQPVIVTSRERAYDLRQPPVFIMGGSARTLTSQSGVELLASRDPLSAGNYARQRMLGMTGVDAQGHRSRIVLRRLHLHHPDPARSLRLLRPRRSARIRQGRPPADRPRTAVQPGRRPSLRGLHPWRERW